MQALHAARAFRGLAQAEAEALLQREGHNDLPSPEHHSLLALLGEAMREPMFATVLCTDKTGTLTENRMSVEHIEAENERWDREMPLAQLAGLPAIVDLLEVAALASEPKALDPIERAVLA